MIISSDLEGIIQLPLL